MPGDLLWPLVAAGTAAALTVLLSLGRTDEQRWLRSWCPRGIWLRYKLGAAAVHALVAVFGALVARSIGSWRPMPQAWIVPLAQETTPAFANAVSWAVDGITYALLTEALLRADVSPAYFDVSGKVRSLGDSLISGLRGDVLDAPAREIHMYVQDLDLPGLHELARTLALKEQLSPGGGQALIDQLDQQFELIKADPQGPSDSLRGGIEFDVETRLADQKIKRQLADAWAGRTA